jgi:hypothetical protein
MTSPTGDTTVLVALCENSWFTEEMDEAHCMGRLHFRWGMGQAKCDTCGAWCGISVAKWERVEPAAVSSSSPDDTAPGEEWPPGIEEGLIAWQADLAASAAVPDTARPTIPFVMTDGYGREVPLTGAVPVTADGEETR